MAACSSSRKWLLSMPEATASKEERSNKKIKTYTYKIIFVMRIESHPKILQQYLLSALTWLPCLLTKTRNKFHILERSPTESPISFEPQTILQLWHSSCKVCLFCKPFNLIEGANDCASSRQRRKLFVVWSQCMQWTFTLEDSNVFTRRLTGQPALGQRQETDKLHSYV